jgi:16S rRNA processing protein RimM
MVRVGRIVRPQGRRGEVIVEPDTDFAEARFREGSEVWARRDGTIVAVTLTGGWPHQGRWVIGLGGVESIDAAESWRDVELRVPAESLPPLDAGAYYVHDLLGCRVETLAGQVVGDVVRVDLAVGPPLLAVAAPRGEVLVPLAEAICRRVDVASKVIVIDPPEGLIELNFLGRAGSGDRERT